MSDVVGLDLSLTSTGVALGEQTFTIGTKLSGVERLIYLRDTILHAILHRVDKPTVAVTDLVVMEGYSYAARQVGHQLGELGGVVRAALWEARIPFAVVQPSALKLYATGKGNAPKEAVLSAAVKRCGIEFRTTDESDAWWLRSLGMDYLGDPVVDMPQVNRKALWKVEWPQMALA